MKKNNLEALQLKILNKKALVGVIGLGYVGLPLAVCFAKKGFKVLGVDVDPDRIKKVKKGISYILDVPLRDIKEVTEKKRFTATTDVKQIKKLDAVIICVPTPLGKDKEPDISYIREAVTGIKDNIKPGQIIILESTTYPGTTREILLPMLESTGLKEGKDFYLAFSPERIDPGNIIFKTENTPKVIGGLSPKSTEMAALLYEQVIKKVVQVSCADAAEMVKLLENTFRIVNIALVNELAVLCEKFKLDVWEIIDAAKSKPYGYMPFYPGPGVGGHCIPVDPLYLSWKAKKHGFETKFINLASAVNEEMPEHVVDRVEELLSAAGTSIDGAKVLVLGVAYKKDVKDLRESPALNIIEILEKRGAKVSYHDEMFPFLKIGGIDLECVSLTKTVLSSNDCVILVTDNTCVNYKEVSEHAKLVFDTRNVFSKLNIKNRNVVKL